MSYKTQTPAPDAPLPPPPPHAFASIRAWAAAVDPGSPGSPAPTSPRSRRPSLAPIAVPAPPSDSAATTDDAFDLTALGYTTVFVHLPNTPTTPSPLQRAYDDKHRRTRAPPPPPTPADAKPSGMRRLRSFGILRPRAKQTKTTDVPVPVPAPAQKAGKKSTKVPETPESAESRAEICAAAVAQRKRAKYAYVRPPPTLAQDIAVMQFADGGSTEKNVRRAMEHQARLAGGSGAPMGIATAHVGAGGALWWDADEELEYAHLLDGASEPPPVGSWEPFPAHHGGGNVDASIGVGMRSRCTSISSCDSDLDPARLLPLPEQEDPARAPPNDRTLASRRIGGAELGPGLSHPARQRRAAVHLTHAGGIDLAHAFGRGALVDINVNSTSSQKQAPRPRGKARRRPPPLTLARPATGSGATRERAGSLRRRRSSKAIPPTRAAPPPIAELPEPPIVAAARREFLEDSFAPAPLATATPVYAVPATPRTSAPVKPAPPANAPPQGMMRSVRGLFARRA